MIKQNRVGLKAWICFGFLKHNHKANPAINTLGLFLTVQCDSSFSPSQQKHLNLLNYPSYYQNIVKVFTQPNSNHFHLMVRMFTNSQGDWDSIPGQVMPITQKMVLDVSLLNTQHYKVQIKDKWSNLVKGVAPSPTLWCSNY